MYDEFELEDFAPWMALIITLAGGFLRFFMLGVKGIWADEAFSIWLASMNLGEMLHWLVAVDQHPPLYYTLFHYWISSQGDTPYYVRTLSALLGTATIPLVYLTGRRLSGAAVGLAAAVLMAFSPFNIAFAQEARMYTLLTFNIAAAIYALARLLTDGRAGALAGAPAGASEGAPVGTPPGAHAGSPVVAAVGAPTGAPIGAPIGAQLREFLRAWRSGAPVEAKPGEPFSYRDQLPHSGWRGFLNRRPALQTIGTDLAWIALIVFTAAALYSHNIAVLFLAAINVFVLGLMFYQYKIKPVSAPALQAPSLANWVKSQVAILLLWLPWVWVVVRQAGRLDRQFWIPEPTWEIVFQTLGTLLNASVPGSGERVAVFWLLGGLLALGVVYYRRKLSIFFFLAALFFVPFLGELIVSIRRPIFYDRTLIWLTIPLLLLLAAGIAQLKYRALSMLALGVVAASFLLSTVDYFRWYQKEDWYSAAGYVALYAEEGDLVLFNSNFMVIPFDYYFREYEDLYQTQVEKRGLPLDLIADQVFEPKMTEQDVPALISLLEGRSRVWLVYSHNDYTDPDGLIPQTLAAQMEMTRMRQFYGGWVQLFTVP